jgi:cytochrome c oxidase cbb3-type subunit III
LHLGWIERFLTKLVFPSACWLVAGALAAQAPRDVRNPAAPAENPFASEADITIGRQLFESRCGVCHGRDGEGGRGAALNTGQFRHGSADREMFLTIRYGIPNTEMPGTFLPDIAVWRLVAYVQRLGSAKAAEERAPGDPEAGRAVYASQGCAACHRIDGAGGDMGPDLSAAGARSALSFLRESIVDPSVYIPPSYRTVTIITTGGAKIRGLHLNEDDYSIQIRDLTGNLRSFLKSDLGEIEYDRDSLMPPYRTLSETDLENLLAYLKSLKGSR